MRVLALAVVQPAAGGDSNTAIVVAAIGAVGLILAALITVIGSRSKDRFDAIDRRFDAIEKAQAGLAAALERLERRMEDGLVRLADRIDRLYGTGSRTPPRPRSPIVEVVRPSDEPSDELVDRVAERLLQPPGQGSSAQPSGESSSDPDYVLWLGSRLERMARERAEAGAGAEPEESEQRP